MSILAALSTFITGTYTVTRKTQPTNDAFGRKVAGTTSTFSIDANVQPLSGRDLKVLPEGQRAEQVQWLYTATKLYVRQPGYEPDVVTVDGDPWVITSVETWNYFTETFYRCRIARRTVP